MIALVTRNRWRIQGRQTVRARVVRLWPAHQAASFRMVTRPGDARQTPAQRADAGLLWRRLDERGWRIVHGLGLRRWWR